MNKRKHSKYNRERIVELRQLHPEMTLKEIGNEVSLTKERVRQILVKEKLTTLSIGGHTTKPKFIKSCKQCGSMDKQFKTRHSRYCSTECMKIGITKSWVGWRARHPDRWTTFQCAHCGKDKTVRTTYYQRQKRTYQSQYCSSYCNMASQWADVNSLMSNRKYKPRTRNTMVDLTDNI